jgi:hypothetical protein
VHKCLLNRYDRLCRLNRNTEFARTG